MQPSDAARQYAADVLQKWLAPDEPRAELEARGDYEALLGALRAAGVDIMADTPLEQFHMLAAMALLHGRHEAEILDALWSAADGLADLLDTAVLARDRLAHLAELLSSETKGGMHG